MGIGGTLSPAAALTRLGCSSAVCHTTMAPQSWPMNTARSRADVVKQSDEVAGQGVDVVVLDGLGPGGTAVAALVRGQHVVARVGQHRYLMPPRIRQFWKAVGQHDDGCSSFAGLESPAAARR